MVTILENSGRNTAGGIEPEHLVIDIKAGLFFTRTVGLEQNVESGTICPYVHFALVPHSDLVL